jgi:hypothetical protein
MGSYELDGDRTRLLVSADVHIEVPTVNGPWVIIPEAPRKLCERAIESAANAFSVVRRCSRSMRSPHPPIALEGETAEEQDWLAGQGGILCLYAGRTTARAPIDLGAATKAFIGRLDGVFLLAEALAHAHPTGRFHEFTRLFERAFARSGTRLTKPLSEFLKDTPHNFSRREVEQWTVHARHPLTHADERDDLLLEADALRIVGRMEEAAYDVLFNKAEWRSADVARRHTLEHLAGSSGPNFNIFLTQGLKDQVVETQLFDVFGVYPSDFSAALTKLPERWWAKFSNES